MECKWDGSTNDLRDFLVSFVADMDRECLDIMYDFVLKTYCCGLRDDSEKDERGTNNV